nr:GTPase IMAP family member 7-like [Danio rerio]|eukprot:XP_021327701.1 GTPase IMAP family member 7-like [Danio rerio]
MPPSPDPLMEANATSRAVFKDRILDTDSMSAAAPLRIVLVGKTGVGKSAVGNTILGQKEFRSEMSSHSVTSKCSTAQATVSGRSVSVVDTPGFFDTKMKQEDLATEMASSVWLSSPGPHAFLIVFRIDERFTELEEKIPLIIKKIFREEVLKYSIILFTRGDQLDGKSVEKLIEDSSGLRSLVQQCGGRYKVFNNRDVNNREQVEDLLQKIDSMIQQNGGAHYSNQMYEDAHRFRQRNEDGGGFFEFLDKYWPYFVAAAITVILAIIGGPHKLAFFAGIVSAIAATFSTTNAGKTKQQ